MMIELMVLVMVLFIGLPVAVAVREEVREFRYRQWRARQHRFSYMPQPRKGQS